MGEQVENGGGWEMGDGRWGGERWAFVFTNSHLPIPNSRDSFRCFQREAAREDGKGAKEAALGFGEQIEAPGDGGAKRLVPRQSGAIAACEQPEPIVQARRDLGSRE